MHGTGSENTQTSVLRVLKLICAGGSDGQVTVTKKGLLDLLERLQPAGPVNRPDQSANARVTYARKLSRILKSLPTLKLGKIRNDMHNEVYKVEVVKPVLDGFEIASVSEVMWDSILSTLRSCARQGSVLRHPFLVDDDDGSSTATPALPRSEDLQDLQDTISDGPPSGPSAASVHSEVHSLDSAGPQPSQPSHGFPVVGPNPMPIAPTVFTAAKKRKLEEKPGFKQYQQVYGGHTWTDLLHEVMSRDQALEAKQKEIKGLNSTIQSLRQKSKTLSQTQRRLGQAAAKLKDKLKWKPGEPSRGKKPGTGSSSMHEASVEEKMAIRRTGTDGEGRYLTVQARLSLSIRRNLSNVACADLGLILLDNASRWTVARAEVHSGAALICSGRAFHRNMMEEIVGVDSPGETLPPSLHIHFITQDATNSIRRKMTALILHTAWCQLPSSEAREFSFDWKSFQTFHGVADVHTVTDSSALATVALTHKMLQSLECPSIKTLLDLKMDSTAEKQIG